MVLTLSQLNGITDFARTDKWDVSFRGESPEGFSGWLPATDLTTPVRSVSTFDFNSGHRMLSIPKAQDYPDISMTLIEIDTRAVKTYFKKWFDQMFPDDNSVAYLTSIARILDVRPLTNQNQNVDSESWIVFPCGSMAQSLSSSSSILTFPVTLKVVGKI